MRAREAAAARWAESRRTGGLFILFGAPPAARLASRHPPPSDNVIGIAARRLQLAWGGACRDRGHFGFFFFLSRNKQQHTAQHSRHDTTDTTRQGTISYATIPHDRAHATAERGNVERDAMAINTRCFIHSLLRPHCLHIHSNPRPVHTSIVYMHISMNPKKVSFDVAITENCV